MDSCTTNISKSGKNLFARIPDSFRDCVSRGDRVKITVLERKQIKDEEKIKEELEKFLEKQSKDKLSGLVLGYKIELKMEDLIKNIPKTKLKKILLRALLK